MGQIIYFSSRSENTHRFVTRLGLPAWRIPINTLEALGAAAPYVLIVPTYGDQDGPAEATRGAVPKQVIRFLNDTANQANIRGVIAAGNRNFGASFGLAGDIISQKYQVPYLYRFELLGTQEDIVNVRHGLERFWIRQAFL